MSREPAVDMLLPLKPVELELLLALVDGERHGYGLVQAIAERTEGVIRLEPGNLYRVIKRLLGEGLVREAPSRAAAAGAERRRYYRLTAHGARVAAAELHRIRSVLYSGPARALAQRLHPT